MTSEQTNHNVGVVDGDKICGVVVYMDEVRKPHLALVTNDFYKTGGGPINLAYVNDDINMQDPYGQQLIRKTSVAFWGSQGYRDLMANCWMYVADYKNCLTSEKDRAKINGRLNEQTFRLMY